MFPLSLEDDISKTKEAIFKFLVLDSVEKSRLDTQLNAAFRLFYSKGHQAGYDEGIDDALNGVDKRVIAHLN